MLQKNNPYHFKGKTVFKTDYDTVIGFVMPDYDFSMHEQDFYELNIILNGSGTHYIGGNTLSANRGDVFIIPPGIAHGYSGGKGFDVYHLLLSDRFMQKHTAELWSLPEFHILFKAEPLMRKNTAELFHLSLTETQMAQIENILSSLMDKNTERSSENLILINSYAVLLTALLCNIYRKNAKILTDEKTTCDRSFMDAISLIHTRFDEKLTLERLSKTARLSRSAFIRRFNGICGMPPAEYITNIRLEAAERLLLNSMLPLSEIAAKTGFYDASHLSNTFKEKTGKSPSEYRKLGADNKYFLAKNQGHLQ